MVVLLTLTLSFRVRWKVVEAIVARGRTGLRMWQSTGCPMQKLFIIIRIFIQLPYLSLMTTTGQISN